MLYSICCIVIFGDFLSFPRPFSDLSAVTLKDGNYELNCWWDTAAYILFVFSKVSFISQKTTKEGFVGLDDISISAGNSCNYFKFYCKFAKDIFLLQQRSAESIIFDTKAYCSVIKLLTYLVGLSGPEVLKLFSCSTQLSIKYPAHKC